MQPCRLRRVAVVAATFHPWPRTTDRERFPGFAEVWKQWTAEALRAETVGVERHIRRAQGLLRLLGCQIRGDPCIKYNTFHVLCTKIRVYY